MSRYTLETYSVQAEVTPTEDKAPTARQLARDARELAAMLEEDSKPLDVKDAPMSRTEIFSARAAAIRAVEKSYSPKIKAANAREGIVTHLVKREYTDFLLACVVKGLTNDEALQHLRTSTRIKGITASKLLKLVRPMTTNKSLLALATTNKDIQHLLKHTPMTRHTFGQWTTKSTIGAVMNTLRNNIVHSKWMQDVTASIEALQAQQVESDKRTALLEAMLSVNTPATVSKVDAQALARELSAKGMSARVIATTISNKGFSVSFKTISRWVSH
jgi:hypothetical protein